MKQGATLEQWARRKVAELDLPAAQRRAVIVALMESYLAGAQDSLSDLSTDLRGKR